MGGGDISIEKFEVTKVKLTEEGKKKYRGYCEAAVENYKNGLDMLRAAVLERDMESIKDGHMITTECELREIFGEEAEGICFERI